MACMVTMKTLKSACCSLHSQTTPRRHEKTEHNEHGHNFPFFAFENMCAIIFLVKRCAYCNHSQRSANPNHSSQWKIFSFFCRLKCTDDKSSNCHDEDDDKKFHMLESEMCLCVCVCVCIHDFFDLTTAELFSILPAIS